MSSNGFVIETKNLTKNFGNLTAVDDLNLGMSLIHETDLVVLDEPSIGLCSRGLFLFPEQAISN